MFSKLVGSKASSYALKSKEDTWNATVKNKALPRSSVADLDTTGIRETLVGANDDAAEQSIDVNPTLSKDHLGAVRVTTDASHSATHAASEPENVSSKLGTGNEHGAKAGNCDSPETAPMPIKASAADASAVASFLDSDDEDDSATGDGGFVEAAPPTQTHAVTEHAKMASFLDSDDDDDDDDDDGAKEGHDHGTFAAASETSKALAPGVKGKDTDVTGSLKLENDNGAGDTSLALPGAQVSAKNPATRPATGDAVANFLNDSDDDDADMQDRLMPAAKPAASGKTNSEQKKIANFLDNSDDDEDDEPHSTLQQRVSSSSSSRVMRASPAKNTRLKKITHADADDLLCTLDAAGLALAPPAAKSKSKSGKGAAALGRPGIGASDKPPSILKLNQFNKEAGQTLFQNLFRKRYGAETCIRILAAFSVCLSSFFSVVTF